MASKELQHLVRALGCPTDHPIPRGGAVRSTSHSIQTADN